MFVSFLDKLTMGVLHVKRGSYATSSYSWVGLQAFRVISMALNLKPLPYVFLHHYTYLSSWPAYLCWQTSLSR